MNDSESITFLSFGTETEQWFVNYSQGRYFLTHINRATHEKRKARVRREEVMSMMESMTSEIASVMKNNAERILLVTPRDHKYGRPGR